ncbi:hypothetical protein P175DRAFT_0495250 [Aspergillus ochraceoroseus IBT 24754]|uniref:Uncharacterized protein n=1 Tax=Aspergillus ochraceoroseus IBT 24754 TaxID=1392256 RepID=A0A2T5LRK4_9EURO|nr:uncharacterized protein P175DRAFT_0495250 [Aspergillus ochraceoroseus IBT 24754]PTU18907.1 hypothetical protein P175DRAFT_0495250 [Aspergillus ochraceoroseus IBT 24754]
MPKKAKKKSRSSKVHTRDNKPPRVTNLDNFSEDTIKQPIQTAFHIEDNKQTKHSLSLECNNSVPLPPAPEEENPSNNSSLKRPPFRKQTQALTIGVPYSVHSDTDTTFNTNLTSSSPVTALDNNVPSPIYKGKGKQNKGPKPAPLATHSTPLPVLKCMRSPSDYMFLDLGGAENQKMDKGLKSASAPGSNDASNGDHPSPERQREVAHLPSSEKDCPHIESCSFDELVTNKSYP